MAGGRLAVAAPDRVLSRPARRAAVNDICRGWSFCPARWPLRAGAAWRAAAGEGAGQLGAADPCGVLLVNQLRGFRAEDRPGGRPGAGDGGLGFLQRGLEPVHRQA